MFRSLAINTAISAMAFFIVSIVGILLVPLLVSSYGLDAFGLLVLLRLFLPAGVLGALDFGVSETTSLAIARARVDGSWSRAKAQVSLLLLLSIITACVLAIVLVASAGHVATLFNVSIMYSQSFTDAVRVTGVGLILLFPGLVFDGIVKGYEAYRGLRVIEVISTLSYALAAVLLVYSHSEYVVVHYAFVGSVLLKMIATVWFSFKLSSGRSLFGLYCLRVERRDVYERCRLMLWNKMLGAMQYQLSPLLIGALLMPAAVAIYDILMRLSRFTKSIFGLLNAALVPFAARLDAVADRENMQRLGQSGFLVVAAITVPMLSWAGAFSEPILRLWIGPDLQGFWVWLAITFVIPALGVFVSFGGAALLGRKHVVAHMNRLVTLQLMLQFGIAFAFFSQFQERAFILSQALAVLFTFLPQMRLIFREQVLVWILVQRLLLVAVLAVVLIVVAVGFGVPFRIGSALSLAGSLLLWMLVFWAMIYFFVLSSFQRASLVSVTVGKKS